MEENTKRRLREDYRVVNEAIRTLIENPVGNCMVVKPHYVAPTILSQHLPLDDKRGEFVYFRELREVLEDVLGTGRIDRNRLPQNAPDYLERLAE